MNFIMYSRALINENKFRASRYGIDGKLIDFGKEREESTRVLITELLNFIDDVVPHLGSKHFIEQVPQIMEQGTGADKQLRTFEQYGKLENVVDFIHDSFLEGC
jgi:carboxylate-amine ligase